MLAFNEFGLGTVALKPKPWGIMPNGEWTDHEDHLAAEWLRKQGILVSVQTAARDRPFHPVKKYLQGLHRDGVERVDCWLPTYLGTEDTEYSRAVGSRWLTSAVARIFRPGAKADCWQYFTEELADWAAKTPPCRHAEFGSSNSPNWTA